MQVRQIMTEDVKACAPSDTCGEAVRIMWDYDCGIVPIVDSDARVIGAITDRDIAIACWSRDTSPGELSVGDTMSRDVQCCGPEDSVSQAEQLMEKFQVRRLPVADGDGCLCGIISLADITRRSEARGKGADKADMRPEKVVEAYAAVCQPRSRSERLHS